MTAQTPLLLRRATRVLEDEGVRDAKRDEPLELGPFHTRCGHPRARDD